MLRQIIRGLLVAVAVLVALAAVVVLTLRPPAPLTAVQDGLVLAGVTVVNPGIGRRVAQRITIHGSMIESISGDNPGAADSPDTHRYPGAYVLPGLIDMHVHHPPARAVADVQLFGLMHLAHGVTTVRDTGDFGNSILRTRAQILEGEFAGPRIFACGPLIDGDPPVWAAAKVVHNAAEAERAVDELAATGVHCIKAYQNLTPEALRGLRDAATRHHLPLLGHVPFAVPFDQAHLDDIQHLTGVPVVPESLHPGDFAEGLMAVLRAWEEIDEARISFVVRTSVQQKLVHTPTLVVLDQLSRLGDYPGLLQEPEAQTLPRYYREVFWEPATLLGDLKLAPKQAPELVKVRENFRAVVRRLHEAGVTLHVGTDAISPFVVPGTALQKELRDFVECGFTPEQAWNAATRENGAALPEPGLGTIAEGAPADLLVFREDPTLDLDALSTLEAVVADGRFYSKQTLEAATARYRHKFQGFLYDHITTFLFRRLMASQLPTQPHRGPGAKS